MYAEERQQAMAQLVAERGPRVGERHRLASTTSPPRPCAATSRPSSGWAWSAGSTAGRCRRTASPRSSPGWSSATPRTPSRRSGSRARPSTSCPPAGSTVLIDAGTTTHRLASLLPRDLRLTVVTHAVPVAARLAGNPRIELHLLPGRVRPTTQAAVGTDTVEALSHLRADVLFLGTNGDQRRPRPDHPRPRRGRHEARHGRERTAYRAAGRRHEDRASSPRSASPPWRRST